MNVEEIGSWNTLNESYGNVFLSKSLLVHAPQSIVIRIV